MRKTLTTLALTAMTLTSCSPSELPNSGSGDTVAASPASETPGMHPVWTKNATLYEVNIRQYTPEGTFVAFTQELPRIRALGVDVLWIMPVQPIGKLNRKGSLGSYYSISDYTAFNPEFGTEADFKAMVSAAHALGFKVILDWVANHTAFDHHWTREHKDWYTLKPDGTISRAIDDKGKETDWSDVADLNYANRDLRRAMIAEMQWWVDSTGIDGFRCDMAGLVPTDFWAEMRTAIDARRPGLFYLAEWEDPSLHRSFSATYSWVLFHLMDEIAQGKKSTSELTKYFASQDSSYDPSAFRLTFTSNHDENSWNGTEFERMGVNHQAAYVLMAASQNALPMIYSGQEASFNRRLKFFEKDQVDWTGASLANFYSAVIELRRSQEPLWSGPWGGRQTVLTTDGGDRVYTFVRARGEKAVVVVANFGDATRAVRYASLAHPGAYTDWFTKATVTLTSDGSIEVPANGYRVLVK